MALTCPVDLDREQLKSEVMNIYGRVASDPSGEFHFHRGARYAVEFLGYDPAELETLPAEVTAAFAGVGNPHRIAPVSPGETVLDIGCGAGMDLLLAARKVGPTGKAIGVDMTTSMIERARAGAKAAGLPNVEIRQGSAEVLPLEDGTIDVVISNGVLNLTPDKRKAFGEIARVVRPGGRILLADIIIGTELSEKARRDIDLWTGWIAGALSETELIEVLETVGFQGARITNYFDCFRATSKESLARKYGVQGVNAYAARAQVS